MANHEWRMTSWWDVCSPSIYLHKTNGSNRIQTQFNRLVWFRFDCVVCCMDQFHLIRSFKNRFSIANFSSLHNLNDLFMWMHGNDDDRRISLLCKFFVRLSVCVCVCFFVYCFKTIKNIEFIFITAALESVIYACRLGLHNKQRNFRDKQSKSQSHQFCGIKW